MRKLKKIAAALLAASLLSVPALSFGAAKAEVLPDGYNGFIKASGRQLLDESGKEYYIRGIGFGNNIWINPDNPPENIHHTEDSYRELAQIGFNNIRFYMNYHIFESDDTPYKYKESGFEWLDKNIAWAKKYGIRLVLNMHYPQGGYQSQGNGEKLWQVEENQKRLIALWTEIAKRYADEPTILGYGIVNEPYVIIDGTAQDGLKLWQSLAQNITDSIRTVDKNHPVFVERMMAFKNGTSGSPQWADFNGQNNFFKIDDDNVVYEFHDYDPYSFTHQDMDWAGTKGSTSFYPDPNTCMVTLPKWTSATFDGEKADNSNADWQYLESSYYTAKDTDINAINFCIQAQGIGASGKVYSDDMKITEYDENGKEVRVIYFDDYTSEYPYNFWTKDGSGKTSKGYKGHGDYSSLLISGTTDDANCASKYFIPVQGHSYKASCYVKVSNVNSDALVRPRIDCYKCASIEPFTKVFLEKSVKDNIQFSIDNNVPIYCGEFGACLNSFKDGRGGNFWVADMLDIFKKYNVGYSYHDYHEESFGLYLDAASVPPKTRNKMLIQTFLNANNKTIASKGDINYDDVFDLADIVAAQKYCLGMNADIADWKAGDLNVDNKFNAADLTLLKQLILN